MEVENHTGGPLSEEDKLIQSCVAQGDSGHQQPKDYSGYLNFITIYMVLLSLLFMIFFKTDMKRTMADEDSKERTKNNQDIEKSTTTSGTKEENETLVQEEGSSSASSASSAQEQR